jgi:hypothetical protein
LNLRPPGPKPGALIQTELRPGAAGHTGRAADFARGFLCPAKGDVKLRPQNAEPPTRDQQPRPLPDNVADSAYHGRVIRRHLGDRLCLIEQHEHALLAGRLAGHWGNAGFARVETSVVTAASLHDCGWRDFDRSPLVDARGWPCDVFATPLPAVLRNWAATGPLLESEPPHVRLLVSLHLLRLSGLAAAAPVTRSRREVFELNRFQHNEIERQDTLRRQLGLATDVPLHLGLAVAGGSPQEDQLRRDHLILQALDRLSLLLCGVTAELPPPDVVPRPGARAVVLCMERIAEWSVRVRPWPFDAAELQLTVPARWIETRRFAEGEIGRVLAATAPQAIAVSVVP